MKQVIREKMYCKAVFYLLFFLPFNLALSQENLNQNKIDSSIHFVTTQMFEKMDTALVVCENALEIVTPKSKDWAILMARKAVIQDVLGESEKAVEGFLSAIAVQIALQDSAELSYSYNNLGISYFYRYQYEEALKYYSLSAEIDSLQNNLKGWSGTMINKAVIYSNTRRFKEAQQIYDIVLNKMESIGDHSLNGSVYLNSAKLHFLSEEFDAALKKTEMARPFILDMADPAGQMTLEVTTASIYLRLKKFDAALTAAKRGLSYDVDSTFIERRMHLYECISHIYYAKTMVDSGDYYNDKYQQLRDYLFNTSTMEKVNEIQAKYDLIEKDKALYALKLEEERQRNLVGEKAQIAAENAAQRNMLIAIAAVLVIMGMILLYRNRLKRAEELVLKEKLKTNELLIEQKEAFIGEIHHRVKNNLQLVASMLAIQSMQSDNETIKKVFDASKSRIESMSLIHQKLYQSSDFERVNIEEYVINLSDQILGAYTSNKKIVMQYDIISGYLHIDSIIPMGLILNELITNSIKYAFREEKNPLIKLRIHEEGELLVLNYADNGNGFRTDSKKGFGTHLIHSLARQLKAEIITFDSGVFNLELRIKNYIRLS